MKIRIHFYRTLVIVAIALCFGACSKKDDTYSVAQGLLQQLQDENPTLSINYLYDGVVEFRPSNAKAGIAFYPGGDVEYTAYAPLMVELAKQGYLCLLIRMPANMAMMGTSTGPKLRKQYPEIVHFYLAGHSLGGSAAAMSLASHLDDFDGLILLAAYSTKDLSQSGKNVISIYGSEDGVLSMNAYGNNKKNLPADLHEYIIEGGNHSGFGFYGHQAGDNPSTITPSQQMAETATYIATWAN